MAWGKRIQVLTLSEMNPLKNQMSVSLVLTSSNFAHLNTIQTDPGLFMW